jgi:hypothetical protein
MIFERPDSPFGGVGSMFLGRDTLEVDPVFVKGVLEGLGTFVVKNV